MSRLRVVRLARKGGLSPEQMVALEFAGDAACERAAAPLTAVQVVGLLESAPYLQAPQHVLKEAMREGDCNMQIPGTDPEAWQPQPRRNPDPFSVPRRLERGEANELCGGCPVRAQCLAWALCEGRAETGVYGGLSEQDRRDLAPVVAKTRAWLASTAIGASSATKPSEGDVAEAQRMAVA
jgi:WhiB family transcriptional regulator, redox-sensing transcriptional regulator